MDTCSFCAEDLPEDAERCPSCGERLGEIEPRPSGMPGWAIALVVFGVGALLLCVVGGAMSFLMLGAVRSVPVPARPGQSPTPTPPAITMPSEPLGGATDAQVAALPLQTGPTSDLGGAVSADRQTYAWGGYGITEIGRVRLAVRGLTFSGRSSGGVAVHFQGGAGGGGSTGSGARRFTHTTLNGVTTCTFGGQTFTIQGGILTLGKVQLDTLGPTTQVLLVDPDGSNPVVLSGP